MIKLEGVKKTYGKKELKTIILNNLNLKIDKGEMVAIIGKSGSGKSTLLNILGGITDIDEGIYQYEKKELELKNKSKMSSFRRDNVGFIIQTFALIDDLTVYENIAIVLKLQDEKKMKSEILDVIAKLGLGEKANSYIDELSRGQQQKVAIARAIIKKPALILADEPTGALDEVSGKNIMSSFIELNKQGSTIVIVTHDMDVAKICNKIYKLENGNLHQIK